MMSEEQTLHTVVSKHSRKLRKHFRHAYAYVLPLANKRRAELNYWKRKHREQGHHLGNAFYEWFYTTYFELTPDFYEGKRILDTGCGPRGSLEWARMASERVGVDPLADKYRQLGADRHAMRYVNAGAESIPFADAHFDVVCALNSLDHVDDVERAIREIKRLTKPKGLFLLVVEVNHPPTNTEPLTLPWSVVDRFRDCFEVLDQRAYEVGDHCLYSQLRQDDRYDHTDPTDRPALITAKLRRMTEPGQS